MSIAEQPDRSTVKRRGANWYSRAKIAEAGEIGAQIGQCSDVALRESLRHDLEAALRTLFPQAFPLPFSRDHRRVIEIMQRVATDGGQFAVAMPRGYGKTTIAVRTAIWAILYGHRKSAMLVAASDPMALKMLRGVKDELRFNDMLASLFPEACVPIRALEGKALRCQSQTVNGVSTAITWKADELIMPSVAGSASSGARFGVAGITGGKIRGQQHTTVRGEVIRPDIVIVDDPQDRESAKSPTQTADRLDVINGDILGMAGPTVKMACVIPCTVIQEDDLADRLLDRVKNPQFQGVRTKMLDSMPVDEKHWEEYRDIRARAMREERPAEVWNQYLRDNWDAMHSGAIPSWPERFKPDELSAVQSAMNWYFNDPASFAAEAQNEPLRKHDDKIEPILSHEIGDRANGLARGIVPAAASHLTAFVDVQGKLLYWLVAAFSDDFTGHVVDYGTFPDQKRMVFTLNDAKRTLAHVFPGSTQEGQIYDGLERVASEVFGRHFEREDGTQMTVERFLVDSGAWTDTIYKWTRETQFRHLVNASKGRGITARSVPMSDYKARTGEKMGHYWLQRSVGKGTLMRVIEPDTNYWKSQAYRRLKMSRGDRGAISLFGKTSDHPTFSAHCCAEYPIEKSEQGRRVWEWHLKVERPDNHWWDCLVGCLVAASVVGCQMTLSQSRAVSSPQKTARKSLAEMARGR